MKCHPTGWAFIDRRLQWRRVVDGQLKVLASLSSREWRNWQTRWLQVPVPERVWGFKSPLAHSVKMASDLGFSSRGQGPFALKVLEKVLSPAEVLCESVYCRPLHGRRDMAVDVHRRGDRGVPKPLLHHLRVLPEFEQQGRVGVADSFDGDPCEGVVLGGHPGESPAPAVGDGVGSSEVAVTVAEDVGVGFGEVEGEFGASDLV